MNKVQTLKKRRSLKSMEGVFEAQTDTTIVLLLFSNDLRFIFNFSIFFSLFCVDIFSITLINPYILFPWWVLLTSFPSPFTRHQFELHASHITLATFMITFDVHIIHCIHSCLSAASGRWCNYIFNWYKITLRFVTLNAKQKTSCKCIFSNTNIQIAYSNCDRILQNTRYIWSLLRYSEYVIIIAVHVKYPKKESQFAFKSKTEKAQRILCRLHSWKTRLEKTSSTPITSPLGMSSWNCMSNPAIGIHCICVVLRTHHHSAITINISRTQIYYDRCILQS